MDTVQNFNSYIFKVVPKNFKMKLTISSVSVPCPGGEVKARDTLIHLQCGMKFRIKI
jgi:hypothetical protein